jgi:23S rRNA pseudouridine1911/1915/1917 synthase
MKDPTIIYQDEAFFIVDKPSGWISNDSHTTTIQPVLQTWLRKNFDYPLNEDEEKRHGIVHRLDKDTSGIMVVAKTGEVFEKIQAQFKNREVEKTYKALLHGKVDPPEGTIEVEVGRLPWRRDRFGIVPGGRASRSLYKLLQFIPGDRGGYSLTEFHPKTGRTHQIRIHAKHIGHAVVSDEFYAGRKTARNDRQFCPRLFLHATEIQFTHPLTNEKVKFTSKLPDELEDALRKISES